MRKLSPPSSQQSTSESYPAAAACEHSPPRPIASRCSSSHCITSPPPTYRSCREARRTAAWRSQSVSSSRAERCSRVNARRGPAAAYALSCRPLSGGRVQLFDSGRTVRVGAACLQDVVRCRWRWLQCVPVLKLAPRKSDGKVESPTTAHAQDDHLRFRTDERARSIRPYHRGTLHGASELRMVVRAAHRYDI